MTRVEIQRGREREREEESEKREGRYKFRRALKNTFKSRVSFQIISAVKM